MSKKTFFFLATILILSINIYSQQLAFPDATGAGAYVTGGRGKTVFVVSNLNDNGTGSFRQAIIDAKANAGGIITFSVSGTIAIATATNFDNLQDITIAGETAPKGGITLTNQKVRFRWGDNVVIRHIRFRPDYNAPTSIEDGLSFMNCTNYILDHCSVSWGKDEVLSTTEDSWNITWQRNLIAEGKTGSLMGNSGDPAKSYNLSCNNNLYYNITHRVPNISANGRVDVINNVIFNYKFRHSMTLGTVDLNHINNYYSKGCLNDPSGAIANKYLIWQSGSSQTQYYDPEIHTSGNYVTGTLTNPSLDNWFLWRNRGAVTSGPYAGLVAEDPAPLAFQKALAFTQLGNPFTIKSATNAFTDVTTDVGANTYLDSLGNKLYHVDELDSLFLANTTAGNCINYVSSSSNQDYDTSQHYLNFFNSVSSTPINDDSNEDSNNDGIPDAWKICRGFSISQDLTTHLFASGYVGIEEYLYNPICDTSGATYPATGVIVSPNPMTMSISQTKSAMVTFAPINATDKTGVWSSSNAGIATVNITGDVTGVNVGSAYIKFISTDGGFSDSLLVNVLDTNNLYPVGDAANPTNEVNAVGWVTEAGDASMTSVPNPSIGNYALMLYANSANYSRWIITLTGLTAGKVYDCTFDAKCENAAGNTVGDGYVTDGPNTNGVNIISNSYNSYTITFSATSNTEIIRAYPTLGTEAGRKLWIDNVVVTEQNSTNITSSTTNSNDFKIYPNPVSDKLTLAIETNIEEVAIIDSKGSKQKVYLNNNSIDVSMLAKGFYTVKVRTKNNIFNSSFIKK